MARFDLNAPAENRATFANTGWGIPRECAIFAQITHSERIKRGAQHPSFLLLM
jgi:hypothetical protein